VQPDPSFGDGKGYATLSIRGQDTIAYAATAVSGGTVVVGQATPASGNGAGQVLVAKYDQHGRLDPAFGTLGVYRSSFPDADGPFIANGIAEDSHGRLVVAGGYGGGSVLVLRLTAAGHVDPSFGTGGHTVVDTGGIGQSVTIEKHGAILVGSSNANENGRPMVVLRLTPNGAVDPSFGTDGKTEILFWDANHAASAGVAALAARPNGAIVGAGHIDYIGGDGHGSAGVFSLTTSGQLDPAYGTGGGVEVAFTNPDGSFAQWFPCAMALSPNGHATVGGDGSTAAGNAILAARLTASGTLDTGFSKDGRAVVHGASGGEDTTCGAAGASGVFTIGAGSSFAQLLQDGSPNANFAHGGITDVATPGQVAINALVLPHPHTAVLAGTAGNDLYVSRWLLPPGRGNGHAGG
jgi:uncharacterized delta-60 repeat protein